MAIPPDLLEHQQSPDNERKSQMATPKKAGFPEAVCSWETVTPEIARKWLEQDRTLVNRPITTPHIQRLASDIIGGRWIPTTTPIKFNTKGELIDGQHRLRAVIEAGAPIPFLIARNCDPLEFTVQDIGLKRTLVDTEFILSKGDVPFKVLRARMAVSNFMFYGCRTQIGTPRGRVTMGILLNFYHKFEETVGWLIDVGGVKRSGVPVSNVMLAVVGRASFSNDRGRLEAFIRQFRDGNADSPDSPVIRLRDYFLQYNISGGAGQKGMYLRSQTALQAWLQRRTLKTIRPIPRELFLLPGEGDDPEFAGRTVGG